MLALRQVTSKTLRPLAASTASLTSKKSKHTLPDLPYDYNALEPVICAEIMTLHHSKHHQTYVNNYNVAEEKLAEAVGKGDASTVIGKARFFVDFVHKAALCLATMQLFVYILQLFVYLSHLIVYVLLLVVYFNQLFVFY